MADEDIEMSKTEATAEWNTSAEAKVVRGFSAGVKVGQREGYMMALERLSEVAKELAKADRRVGIGLEMAVEGLTDEAPGEAP